MSVDTVLGTQPQAGQPDAAALQKQLDDANERARLLDETNRYMQAEKDRLAAELVESKSKLETKIELTDEQLAEKESALKLGLVDKSEVDKLREALEVLQNQSKDREIQQLATTIAGQVAKIIEEYPFVDEKKIREKMTESKVSAEEAAKILYFDEIALKSKGKPFVPTVSQSGRGTVEPPKGKVPEIGSQEMHDLLTNALFGEE